MARPEIDNTRQPGPHDYLRYVQIYNVVSHAATVKNLKWNGSAFAVIGSPYSIDGSFEVGDIGRKIWIVWRSDAQKWEPVSQPGSGETYRLIRGLAYNAVLASAATFYIDNVILLAGSLDPRTTPGSSSEQVQVTNSQKENFLDNEIVTAIWNGTVWVTLPVERYRAIRGTWYSGTSTLVIDHIVALDSGLDPRSDPTSNTETISVTNVAGDTYGSGDKVYADYNVKDGVWEARPKGGSTGHVVGYTCRISPEINAGTASSPYSGTAEIFAVNSDGTTTSVGTQILLNPFTIRVIGDSTCTYVGPAP